MFFFWYLERNSTFILCARKPNSGEGPQNVLSPEGPDQSITILLYTKCEKKTKMRDIIILAAIIYLLLD